jgi:hypothetical protein
MTSLLSAISGHFNRALIFGTLVPVVMFVSIGGWLLESWLPSDPPWHVLASWGGEWQAAVAFLVVALLTGLLYNINVPLTRMYEGYSWEDTPFGRYKKRRYRDEYDALAARWRGYRTLRYAVEGRDALAAADGTEEQRQALENEHPRIGRDLAESFPQRGSILPTRLGNVIRAFENYPRHQYGMSAIPLWPRLIAVIDSDYAAAITDLRTSFDFMLNCSALAGACALMLIGVGLAFPLPFSETSWLTAWIGEVALLLATAWLFYETSIGRAAAWGQMVKGAFDLYRHELLHRFGFTVVPATLAEERRVWQLISQQIIFGDTRRVQVPPFADLSTHVQVDPPWLALTLHRSVDPPDESGRQRIHLRVTNTDGSRRAAGRVIIIEKLAPNTELVHGSTRPPAVLVEGVNPMRFNIGALGYHVTAEMSFDIVRYET